MRENTKIPHNYFQICLNFSQRGIPGHSDFDYLSFNLIYISFIW